MPRWYVLVEIETDSDDTPDLKEATDLAMLELQLGGGIYNIIPAE